MMFFHLEFLQAKLRSGKDGTFVVVPERHLISLCHWSYLKQVSNGSQSTKSAHSLTNVLQGSAASFLPEQSKKYPTPELTQTLECVRRPPPHD